MPEHDDLDSPTLAPADSPVPAETDDEALARLPALTIIWHPDVDRVGETAVLADSLTEVSRLNPLFGNRRASGSGSPLADVYVSARAPSLSLRRTEQGVDLIPGAGRSPVMVGGATLDSARAFSRDDLRNGVILTLGGRIVLCLHLARPVRLETRNSPALFGISDEMDDIRREVAQIADLDVPVLLRGETGTGKGTVAAAIVATSPRARRPFVSLNMARTGPSTAASELFGHERGSFTGATTSKNGLFAAANGGTLFLDEIGDIPSAVQPMLLHVLETAELWPLGATRGRHIDVRFIAATDKNLERAIAAGTFSEALYHRLARYVITIPPLRARREDIGVLLVAFLKASFTKYREPDRLTAESDPWLPAATVASLAQMSWPGNVRDLENIASQIVAFSRGQTAAALPQSVRSLLAAESLAARLPPSRATPTKPNASATITDEEVAAALARSKGSASRAAKILGVSRTTYYELRKRNPMLRSINEISDEEIIACRDACAGDVTLMATRLGVPVKALKDRLAHIAA